MQGLVGSEGLRRHAVEASLMENYTVVDTPNELLGGQKDIHDQLLKDHVIPSRPLQHLINTKDEL